MIEFDIQTTPWFWLLVPSLCFIAGAVSALILTPPIKRRFNQSVGEDFPPTADVGSSLSSLDPILVLHLYNAHNGKLVRFTTPTPAAKRASAYIPNKEELYIVPEGESVRDALSKIIAIKEMQNG